LGVWFLSISAGNYFAGMVARLYTPGGNALIIMFGSVAVLSLISAVILAALSPYIRRLMGTVR
jgi:dipeptide/tripeptide permease